MILYFSGTGNSKYVAEKLAELLGEELFNIEGSHRLPMMVDDEPLGIVFPVYAWGLPRIVADYFSNKRFVEGTLTKGSNITNKFVWTVMTCGDDMGYADVILEKNIKRTVNAAYSLQMPNTYVSLPGFDIDSPELACKKINGMIIHPNETFSFWKTIGKTTEKEGYKEGLVISNHGLTKGYGGGLCQMANMIHWLVLNSPLTVTELHHHSDALFPDERRRVPFGTGTSVCYNYIDYRFCNTTDQNVQILVWCENGELCGELRSEREFPFRYKLVEENHHFRKEGEKYYRISQVYREVIDRATNDVIKKELILDNHSEVLYDYALIPQDQIRNTEDATENTTAC